MLGSWTDAEDVLQDVSLRAWRGLPRFEARASARAWLYQIATNACLTALRRRRERSLPEVLHSAAPAGEPLGPRVEEARWLDGGEHYADRVHRSTRRSPRRPEEEDGRENDCCARGGWHCPRRLNLHSLYVECGGLKSTHR